MRYLILLIGFFAASMSSAADASQLPAVRCDVLGALAADPTQQVQPVAFNTRGGIFKTFQKNGRSKSAFRIQLWESSTIAENEAISLPMEALFRCTVFSNAISGA